MGDHELTRALTSLKQQNPNLRIFISGDKEARHGDVIHVLDLVRSSGIDKVAFEIQPTHSGTTP
jgi:biopolymer transport protein ExbD